MRGTRPPTIVLSLGDPAGIGPEIVARVLAEAGTHARANVVAVGVGEVLERARALIGAGAAIVPVRDGRGTRSATDRWPILAVDEVEPVEPGVASAAAGRAARRALLRSVQAFDDEMAEAIVAAPLNKHALHLAGERAADQTTLLAELTRSPDALLMPVAGRFRVVSVTNHVALAAACAAVKRAAVARTIRLAASTLVHMGVARPRLAVAALNPHAGEGGDVGREEMDEIAPAVADARAEGLEVDGPFPADSLFTRERIARYDCFVTMYHDQGRIAQKAVAFGRIVVVTAGLPFVFASVGHGSAYDIAWRGVADATSLRAALRLASDALARRYVARSS